MDRCGQIDENRLSEMIRWIDGQIDENQLSNGLMGDCLHGVNTSYVALLACTYCAFAFHTRWSLRCASASYTVLPAPLSQRLSLLSSYCGFLPIEWLSEAFGLAQGGR